jgi:hypothetical protein
VFENRVLRRIFGPKRDEVIGVWRKLHNEELRNLHFSPNIIRMKRIIFWDMTPCSPLSCMRRSSETSGKTKLTTRRHIPEDNTLHNHRCENLKSYIIRTIRSRRMGWTGHVARMEKTRNACKIFLGKPEGKRPLGRPKRRWGDNIRMDLREIE